MSNVQKGLYMNYEVLHKFVNGQFNPGTVEIEDLPDGKIRVVDKVGDSMVLRLDESTGEIFDEENIVRGYV